MNSLPKEFKGSVYFYWNFKYGFFFLDDSERGEDDESLFLGQLDDIDIKFSLTHDEAVKRVVSGLKAEKQKIQARAQVELNGIDEQINSLLAITYQGGDQS